MSSSRAARALDLALCGRPGVAASAGVAAGSAALYGGAAGGLALRGGTVAMLGTMACMVVNDLYDVEKDRAARVNRAIAAGRLSAGTAAAYAALLVVAAVAAAPRTGAGLGLGAVAMALGVLYSVFARAFPVLKGFYTAGCCCLPLVYGAAVTGARAGAVALAGVALFNAGRETFLDAHHVAGDRRFGVRTLGVLLGPRRARALGIGVMFAGTLVLFPGVTTPSGRSSVAAALALLALAVFVLRADDEGLRQWTRVVMVIGAVAAASSVH